MTATIPNVELIGQGIANHCLANVRRPTLRPGRHCTYSDEHPFPVRQSPLAGGHSFAHFVVYRAVRCAAGELCANGRFGRPFLMVVAYKHGGMARDPAAVEG